FQNLTKTQDLVPVYRENSLLYCFERDWFLKSGVRINETSQFWPISGQENIDIDTMEDWYLAEAVAQYEN
ncbi:hypothetical protein OAM61_01235, partial [Schleiferiaceae bacterium]|nr:hypothetical protein [Schleiferiaceae bacterium]